MTLLVEVAGWRSRFSVSVLFFSETTPFFGGDLLRLWSNLWALSYFSKWEWNCGFVINMWGGFDIEVTPA